MSASSARSSHTRASRHSCEPLPTHRPVGPWRSPAAAATRSLAAAAAADQPQIRYLGYITGDEKERFFDELDVLVIPSEWEEPAALVGTEAAARGIPLLVSDRGGIPELPEATVFPARDAGALRDAIAAFACRPRSRAGDQQPPDRATRRVHVVDPLREAGANSGRGEQPMRKRQPVVSLTFDDGTSDHIEVARLLADRGLTATFYVSSGLVGSSPEHLTWDEVAEIAALGHEIGGHTSNHPDLVTLDEEAAFAQISDDRQALTRHGVEPITFAYPYGSQNDGVRALVARAGYGYGRRAWGLAAVGDDDRDRPLVESVPPPDAYALRTYPSIENGTTLAELKGIVERAAGAPRLGPARAPQDLRRHVDLRALGRCLRALRRLARRGAGPRSGRNDLCGASTMTTRRVVAPPPPYLLDRPSPCTFTAIVPAFESADVIGGALTVAARPDARTPDEIIVSDDGSSDDLAAALEPFGDAVTVVRGANARPCGGPEPRTRGRDEATTSRRLDADDEYLPDRLACSRRRRSARPDLDILATDVLFETDGQIAGRFHERMPFPAEGQRSAVAGQLLRRRPGDPTDAAARDRRFRRVAPHLGGLGPADPARAGRRCGRSRRRAALPLPASPRQPDGRPRRGVAEAASACSRRLRSHPGLTRAERQELERSLDGKRRRVLQAEAELAVTGLHPDARNRALALARAPGSSGRQRLSALTWAVTPSRGRRRLAARQPTEQASSSPWSRSSA